MKRSLPIFLFLVINIGCKKETDSKVYQDLVIKAMTDGQWVITNFTLNGTDITSDFSAYKFQYHENKTVDAIKDGSVEKTGNWDGNATTMTTWASFSGVSTPLSYINGTWNIINNGWTYIVATQTVGTETKNMRLDKR